MKILFFDLETTGLLDDPDLKITEIAMAVYDTSLKRTVHSMSSLVNELDDGQFIPYKIAEMTGISTEMVRIHGIDGKEAIENFIDVGIGCDALFARNGLRFDKKVLALRSKAYGIDFEKFAQAKVWMDDYYDIPYPPSSARTLSHVAADHGFLNPFPHQALADVLTLIQCVRGYDLDSAYLLASGPVVELQAPIFEEKDLAKSAGFQWDPVRKVWWKRMRELFAINNTYQTDSGKIKMKINDEDSIHVKIVYCDL